MSDATQNSEPLKVLVYSDDANIRSQVILALGKRPHPDLPSVEYVEVATEPVVIQQMDSGEIDLAILDGEAAPGRRHGHRQAAQGRDLQLPADPGAHRPAAGRLAGDLVARRGRRTAPARPAAARPRPSSGCSARGLAA